MEIVTKNAKQTQSLAKKIAKSVLDSHHSRHAAVVALEGELGAGKTTFAQGFARALGIRSRIVSPTFVIFRKYRVMSFPRKRESRTLLNWMPAFAGMTENTQYKSFYHIDAYRLQNPRELSQLGFKKILSDPKNIVLVEWASKIKKILPRDTIWIKFYHGENESERAIDICAVIC